MSGEVPTFAGRVLSAGGIGTFEPGLRPPVDADLVFDTSLFIGSTDMDDGDPLFTASITNAGIFTIQGYSFSNFRRTAGFAKLAGGTATATARPFVADNILVGDATASTSVTIAVDWTGPGATSGTLSAVLNGRVDNPQIAGVIASFEAINYAAAASPGIFYTGALMFPRGQVATGNTVRVMRRNDSVIVPSAMDDFVLWDDGSLQWVGQLNVVDPTDFTASETRTYDVELVSGSHTPTASGLDPWAWISGNASRDVQIRLTNMTNSAGTPLSPASRTASLHTLIGTTTRRFRTTDHAQIQCVHAWGMFGSDGHRKMEVFAQIYRNAGGDWLGMFCDPVCAQDWYENDPLSSGEGKDRVEYNAALYHGNTLVDTYYGNAAGNVKIKHPYHAAWAAVHQTGNAIGQMRWVAGTESRTPTIWVKPPTALLVASGTFPDLDLTMTAPLGTMARWEGVGSEVDQYVPFHNFGNQPIDGNAGGFAGRGAVAMYDAAFLLNPTFANQRTWLMRSFAGLHRPELRARNHIVDTTLGDRTNRPIPYRIQNASTTSSGGIVTGEIDYLGTREIYGKDKSTGNYTRVWTRPGPASPANQQYYTPASNWSQMGTNSHRPAWGYVAACVTGRRMFRNVVTDNAFATLWNPGSTINITRENVGRENQYRSALGWANRYFTPAFGTLAQTRDHGFGWQSLNNGWHIAGTNDPLKAHLREIMDVQISRAMWQRANIAAQPNQIQYNRGIGWHRGVPQNQWFEQNFLNHAVAMAARRMPNSDVVDYAGWIARQAIQILASDYPLKFSTFNYQSLPGIPGTSAGYENYNPATGYDYATVDHFNLAVRAVSGDPTLIRAREPESTITYRNYWKPTVGDVVQFSMATGTPLIFPPNLAVRTNYYVIETPNVVDFRVSTTLEGSALDIGVPNNFSDSFHAWCDEPQAYLNAVDITDANLRGIPNSLDDYFPIALATATAMLKLGTIELDPAVVTAARTNLRAMWDIWKPYRDTQFSGSPNADGASWLMERP